MTDSQTVATPAKGTVTPATPAEKFAASLQRRAAEETPNAQSVAENQIARVFEAETEDDIWNAVAAGTVQGRDAVGLEIEIRAMTVHPSNNPEFDTWLGVFVTLDCVCLGGPSEVLRSNDLHVGEDFVLSTGAPLVIATVRAFEAREMLPVQAIVRGITTNNGTTVIKLGKMPERAVPGKTA